MAQQGIIPVKLSLTDGDFYTLWAPSWKEHGQEWQAFLGGDDNVYFFHSPAELLAFLSSDQEHDLQTHPKWGAFNSRDAARVVPTSKETMDLVGVPGFLAGRPSHENVSGVARSFAVARSLAGVCALTDVESFFNSHSMLMNVQRGSEHYAGEGGMSEWTSVGHAVLNNWDKILDSLDDIVFVPDTDADAVNTAQSDIDAANIAAEKRRAEEAEAAKKVEEEADPYDASVWGEAGIDPIKIAIDGRLLYSLRTYINGQPVFLGRYGEIYTFNNRRSLVRWLVEHSDHDLASVSTWSDIMEAANGGTLEVQVHSDNAYSFTGIADDIAKGPQAVDTDQMRQAYELLADAADWAADDAVNSILVADPALQEYIAYMLGATSGYVPSAPYTNEVEGWKQLEESLTKRFSKF
jgi:hypothetical protein